MTGNAQLSEEEGRKVPPPPPPIRVQRGDNNPPVSSHRPPPSRQSAISAAMSRQAAPAPATRAPAPPAHGRGLLASCSFTPFSSFQSRATPSLIPDNGANWSRRTGQACVSIGRCVSMAF
ncbi:hypothetical protein AAFF_G00429640 [Aldrovandia affinis]|uniref:Uncharacterized protein n=1 Tax=Aldrovandia affinis TaxID=143900 RepID=A0AAD7S8X0_9TELE|nr:hypothetical protein AAFF_G00429640 [Aldrovandia affinis]